MTDLTGRTVLIAGATSASGLAAARTLTSAGARVVATGRHAEKLWVEAPGSGFTPTRISHELIEQRRHFPRMDGRMVFKNAVRSMADACDRALEKAGMHGDEVDVLIPHQANIRIIEATAKHAHVPMDKVYVNVDRYGNMSSATVPIAFDEAIEQGRLGPGSTAMTVAFGAGLTWGAMTIRL